MDTVIRTGRPKGEPEKRKHTMGKETEQVESMKRETKTEFEQTLKEHLERLIGTSLGIDALPLNLETISCLVLLTERESEIESSPDTPPERYTNETLLDGLAEIGLDADDDLKSTIQEMIQKKHICVDSNDKFSAEKPGISMVRLLDSLFPAMPGMNLVAYLVQTLDEVVSGRKGLESGISQFDQTLQMQGVSPSTQGPRAQPRAPQKMRLKLSEIYNHRQSELQADSVSSSEPRIVSANGQPSQFEIKELFTSGGVATDVGEDLEDQEAEVSAETDQHVSPDSDSVEHDLVEERVSEETSSDEVSSDEEVSLPVSEPTEQITGLSTDTGTDEEPETGSDEIEEVSTTDEIKDEADMVSKDLEAGISDEAVEKRIAGFEKDLAMVCPLCKTGKVQEEQTAKGKHFYACSNKGCVFVSWGKPHHIICSQCNNPFLIESTDKNGKTILRCPRATCRQKEALPGETSDTPPQDRVSMPEDVKRSPVISSKPRRRVVRRRRVRRKKKKK